MVSYVVLKGGQNADSAARHNSGSSAYCATHNRSRYQVFQAWSEGRGNQLSGHRRNPHRDCVRDRSRRPNPSGIGRFLMPILQSTAGVRAYSATHTFVICCGLSNTMSQFSISKKP